MKPLPSLTLAVLAIAKLAQATPIAEATATIPVSFAKVPVFTGVPVFTELPIFTGDVFTAVESARS